MDSFLYGFTPLEYTCYNAFSANVVQYLIELGSDIYKQDRDGRTPLMNVNCHSIRSFNVGAISDIISLLVEQDKRSITLVSGYLQLRITIKIQHLIVAIDWFCEGILKCLIAI